MNFDETLGLLSFQETSGPLITRQAVRAVIFRNGDILMVRSVKGDYKLPGGGIEGNESHEQALRREVEEETGYSGCSVGQKIGTVTERYPDAFEPDAYFEMVSHYYFCGLESCEQGPLRLSQQEAEQRFKPVWISPEEAIGHNKKALLANAANRWIRRENIVLLRLQERAKK